MVSQIVHILLFSKTQKLINYRKPLNHYTKTIIVSQTAFQAELIRVHDITSLSACLFFWLPILSPHYTKYCANFQHAVKLLRKKDNSFRRFVRPRTAHKAAKTRTVSCSNNHSVVVTVVPSFGT